MHSVGSLVIVVATLLTLPAPVVWSTPPTEDESAGLVRVRLAGTRDYRAKWAIIIGIDKYANDSGLSPLKNAANDEREFRSLLVEEFGYDDDHILYLTDAKDEPGGAVDGVPTVEAIRNAFTTWLPDRKPSLTDSVLVFFAGHGLRDDEGNGYLAASNSDASSTDGKRKTCVRVDWLRDQLSDQKTKCRHKLVVLDCCFSGTLFTVAETIRQTQSQAAEQLVSLASEQRRLKQELAAYLRDLQAVATQQLAGERMGLAASRLADLQSQISAAESRLQAAGEEEQRILDQVIDADDAARHFPHFVGSHSQAIQPSFPMDRPSPIEPMGNQR